MSMTPLSSGRSFVIGFTGSRKGMTESQKRTVTDLLTATADCAALDVVGLHGDCVGADLEFDHICESLKRIRYCWPCAFRGNEHHRFRAYTADPMRSKRKSYALQHAAPTSPARRNRGIVELADVMLATPSTPTPRSGGTWMTVGMTRDMGKRLFLVQPDGAVDTKEPLWPMI